VNLYSNNPECFIGYNVQLIDAIGQILETKKYESLVTFDLRGYSRAVYVIRLIGDSGDVVFAKKLVIH
jgi:hypothetical protein